MKKIKRTGLLLIFCGLVSVIFMLSVFAYAAYESDEAKSSEILGIMYHQVSDDASRAGDYIITSQALESDLKYLSENGYTSLLPRELLALVKENKKIPPKTVVITFDDGYESGLLTVLPLLEKYNMKAVISIVGSYTDEYSALTEEEKHPSYAYLTWDEVKSLSDSKIVEIGCHTYNMHSIDSERKGCSKNYDETDEEYYSALYYDSVTLSNRIYEETGVRPVTFAYPYGLISENSKQILSDSGTEVFLTCRELPTRVGKMPVVINRYNRTADRPIWKIVSEYKSEL